MSNEKEPVQTRTDGKKLFIIDGYRIWAIDYNTAYQNYQQISKF